MKLNEVLEKEGISFDLLQKGLKCIGLVFARFENINDEKIPELVDLLKMAVTVDPVKTSRVDKMELRLKITKLINSNSQNNTKEISGKSDKESQAQSAEQNSKIKSFSDLKSRSVKDHSIIKHGKVKFFDLTKGFGYVNSFDDKRDCFMHVSKMLTSSVTEDDIVIFETVNSRKKPGEFDAVRISSHIPVFIFNQESSSRSVVTVLLENHSTKTIQLTEKLQPGFSVVRLRQYGASWKVIATTEEEPSKKDIISFGKKILASLFLKSDEFKSTIEYLTGVLKEELPADYINEIYYDCACHLEKKPLVEINQILKNLREHEYYEEIVCSHKSSLNKISFILWQQNELVNLPNAKNQNEADIWRSDILNSLDWIVLQQVLLRLVNETGVTKQIRTSYKFLLDSGCPVKTKEDLQILSVFLKVFMDKIPEIEITENNLKFENNDFYLTLFKEGILKTLSTDRLKNHIASLKSNDEKATFIETLPSSETLKFYSYYPELQDHFEKHIAGILEAEFSKFNYICFDLESDGNSVTEYAWKTNTETKSEKEFEIAEVGLSKLVALINSGCLVIGQNIREYDLPILQSIGATPSPDNIWDTLEIEMLLNPQRFSYGLKTKHNAASDTDLTLQLFINQVSRIIVSNGGLDQFIDFLPAKSIELFNSLKCNSHWDSLDTRFFENKSNEFFRTSPSHQNISESSLQKLIESLEYDGNKVLIAPEIVWSTLSYQFNLNFYSDDKDFGFVLSREKIESTLQEEKSLRAILLRFIDNASLKGIKPYFQHLPMAIRLKLKEERANLVCDYDTGYFDSATIPVCIRPTEIGLLKDQLSTDSRIKIIVIGHELYDLTSKMQLGQDLDFATIFDRLKNEPIWLQLSGGKSFISIEKRQCELLGIHDFPEYIKNIWLEKVGKGKFRIWCNINLESCINDLPVDEVTYIEWVDETINKSRSYIVRPDIKKSAYIAEQKRVNPESLYRKIYWIYQFKMILGIEDSSNPKVLIVNDELELEKLISYARRVGYFIPDTNASLARQLEILHENPSNHKLLITTFQTLDKVIECNYAGSLDFIWDSFLLQEKMQMLKGVIELKIEVDEGQSEDNFKTSQEVSQKDFDLFSLIKLHKPLIDYYYKILIDNNNESNFYLCDSRLSDFYGIEKSLNLNTKNVKLWSKESEYEADRKVAAEFFPHSPENADTDFNLEEAKEILRNIFLTPEEGGLPFEWYSYQHPCLNEILPAKKDLLISLPTGAGKSVLFQGPALFRSAFSCKLSIIISPLRALMQDQVDALWNRGFYSNVEFLSSDKSPVEIRDIYRRIAGGEIALLYITPERFRSRSFENSLLTRLDADSGLEFVVFDEAHCISQWGQEFRPDYLNAGKKVAGYSEIYQLRKLLFSATISDQVFEEISQLMPGVVTVEGTEKNYNPVRDHIKMDFKHNVVEDERLNEIANYLKDGKFNPSLSRAIVFVKSRKKVEECSLIMSDSLKEVFGEDCIFSEKVGAFHAGMDAEDRKDTYEKYKSGEIVLLFATKAFGMGMDIPNIHFVTHYSPPSTFEDFLQEVGRAGRNEKQRTQAGFNDSGNPIRTLCLTTNNDFAKLKDQLHETRISWQEIKDIKILLEEYISRFKPLIPDDDIPVAVPFNLYSIEKGTVDDDLDNKFRLALHWVERLERIKLGYFTITHLEFEADLLKSLSEKMSNCPDKDIETVCKAILNQTIHTDINSEVVQISIASLRNISKLSLENLFSSLIKAHNEGYIRLLQEVLIEPTKIRCEETSYFNKTYETDNKYPALRVIFSFAGKVMSSIQANSSKFFEGDELDEMLKESIDEVIDFTKLPWSKRDKEEAQSKEKTNYIKDVIKKRGKHAFTVIRLLGKTKHETKIEKAIDVSKKVIIKQSVFNGFHKKNEWTTKLNQIENDCVSLMSYVSESYFEKNIKKFNWADIIADLNLKGNIQYLSDLLFILSVLGYSKTGGLLPTGIEVYLSSVENINESDIQSFDKKIFDEFEETRKVRELKLIALEVLANFNKNTPDEDISKLRKKQDIFIRKYFGCNSFESLLQLLQDELPPNDPLLIKWRGDAIKEEEDRLNHEQRVVYDSEIKQHISVIAGPGSGKTHTLALRVARLVHHIGTMPEEILVLAYNRAVVSELKERLGKLFNELGYGNLARRIKIFTFHGLAKKYCPDDVKGKPFDDWEDILLSQIRNSPGQIMNQLAPLKYILVDEFQDINNVRIKLLNELHQYTNAFIFIIGDPNQSIYGYERLKEGGRMSPWPYYENFNKIFKPTIFELYDNHRSYPDILNLASQILTLKEEYKHLIPRPVRVPDEYFMKNYAEIIDNTKQQIVWWSKVGELLQERVGDRKKPYRQIAILFRTNNEVYRGFQKIKALNLTNVRIRIQGSLPYEFTRIRECHAVISYLKGKLGKQIPNDFRQLFRLYISELIKKNPNWNHFYIRVVHALVLDFLEEKEETQLFDSLLDFISELTYRDDGQLYKIYEKHIEKVSDTTHETEIVLTTMHKVKGLEFDAVMIPPSFANLPLKTNEIRTQNELNEQLEEEKRLAYVSYTRARFRLLIFRHNRELALMNNKPHIFSETANINLGIPVQPEIKKLKIGWAAKAFNFNGGVNEYINTNIKSGDFILVKKRNVSYNGAVFTVKELYKDNSNKPIGELANNSSFMNSHVSLSGFVVNEVVVWTYEDTCKFDTENTTNFAKDWCPEARKKGYIYLVDFAGYGVPED